MDLTFSESAYKRGHSRFWTPLWLSRRADPIYKVSRRPTRQKSVSNPHVTASKAGLEGAVRALQMELEGSGVRATIVRPGPAETEMGSDWDPTVLGRLLSAWKHWGILRHHQFLPAESIAAAVVTAVTAPPGTHLDLIQVNPMAPVRT